MIKGKFQLARLELKTVDIRLQAVVFCFAGYADIYLNRDIEITSIFRFDEPWLIHHTGRGVDIRAKDWTKEEREQIANFINLRFKRKDGKLTCLVHQTDTNNTDTIHFHIQVPVVE